MEAGRLELVRASGDLPLSIDALARRLLGLPSHEQPLSRQDVQEAPPQNTPAHANKE
jgi:hypothetical protein